MLKFSNRMEDAMLKRTCDRCGKTITEGPMARDLSDNMSILTLEIGPFQKIQRYIDGVKTNGYECRNKRMTCDLCAECVESFKKWIGKEKNSEN